MLIPAVFGPRPVVIFQLSFWFVMASFLTVESVFFAPASFNYLRLFIGVASGLVFSQLAVSSYIIYEDKFSRFRLPFFLLLFILISLFWGTARAYFNAEVYPDDFSTQQRLINGFMSSVWVFGFWSGLFFVVKITQKRREEQLKLSQALLENKKAQLQTLRYQLNPHFLFNILNSIDVSVQSQDNDAAHKMIQQLCSFLRNSLQQGEQDKISLQQELAIVQDFVDISKHRFSDAISVDMFVVPDCMDAMIPPMLLQPLVENAVKYAWSQTHHGHLQIDVKRVESKMVIRISNSKQNNSQEIGTGTGLKNIRQRLNLVYGRDATIDLENQTDNFTVKLQLPWETIR